VDAAADTVVDDDGDDILMRTIYYNKLKYNCIVADFGSQQGEGERRNDI